MAPKDINNPSSCRLSRGGNPPEEENKLEVVVQIS